MRVSERERGRVRKRERERERERVCVCVCERERARGVGAQIRKDYLLKRSSRGACLPAQPGNFLLFRLRIHAQSTQVGVVTAWHAAGRQCLLLALHAEKQLKDY